MKKAMTAVIFMVAACTVNAQSSFGPKAGVNISTETANFDNPRSSIVSFCAGLFADYVFAKHFGVQPEILYSSEGTKYTYGMNATGQAKTSYVLIPLELQYISSVGLYVESGPQLKLKLTYNNVDSGVSAKNNVVKSTLFDWTFGVGYHADKVVQGLGINVRYNLGLDGIQKPPVSAGGNTYQKVFVISLSYSIRSKPKKAK